MWVFLNWGISNSCMIAALFSKPQVRLTLGLILDNEEARSLSGEKWLLSGES